ncbi:hypothetical protein CYMTET_18126, partial [Cymbomonas tetramitiformis]
LLTTIIELVTYISTAVFTMEMILTIGSIGLENYFTQFYTLMDFVVVLTSYLEIIFSLGVGMVVLRLLRMLRLFRAIKLFRRWKTLQTFMVALARAQDVIWPFLFLISVFVVTISLFGNRSFEDSFLKDDRFNYDTIFSSILTTIKVMTGSSWSTTVMVSVESKGWIGALFFIFIYVIGNMIFLNVFAAILIDSYCKTLTDHVQEEELSSSPTSPSFTPAFTFVTSPSIYSMPRMPSYRIAEDAINQMPSFKDLHRRRAASDQIEQIALHGRSFGCFGAAHPLRRALSELLSKDEFEYCVMFTIFVSGVLLSLDNPEASPVVRCILEISGIAIAILFTLEMLCKMLVNQALFGHDAYIRSVWNVLDMMVVVISISGTFYPKMMFLRALRSLAALRMFTRIPGIKDVVLSLIESIRKSLTIIIVAAFMGLLFAIMGVQLMAGSFYACTDEAVSYRDDCIGTYMTTEGVVQPREWQQELESHYDNIWTAYLTTFELTTGENWHIIMLAGMDSVGEGAAMKRNASPWMAIYFVIVVFVMMCFFLNMITGIVVDAAHSLLVESLFPGLNPVEKEWMLTLEAIETIRCKPLPQPPAVLPPGP